MRAIKERIFTFSLPFPLRLTSFLDVPGMKKETVMNELQEVGLVGDLCRKHHVIVLSDEIHCDLTSPGIYPFCLCFGKLQKVQHYLYSSHKSL